MPAYMRAYYAFGVHYSNVIKVRVGRWFGSLNNIDTFRNSLLKKLHIHKIRVSEILPLTEFNLLTYIKAPPVCTLFNKNEPNAVVE
jgi:hypothetical protein